MAEAHDSIVVAVNGENHRRVSLDRTGVGARLHMVIAGSHMVIYE